MPTFGNDKKWLEAKKVIGNLDWIEIVSYYRFIEGDKVFVYAVGDGDRRQIIDVLGDDRDVLLLNQDNELETDTYENITNSRKAFEYTQEREEKEYYLEGARITIPIEVS